MASLQVFESLESGWSKASQSGVSANDSGSVNIPFNWLDDDEEFEVLESRTKKTRSWSACFYVGPLGRLPRWSRNIINTVVGMLLIMAPGIADFATYQKQRSASLIDGIPANGYIILGDIPLVLWCLHAAGAFLLYRLCKLVVFLFPWAIARLSLLVNANLPRNFEIYMGYINDLRHYISGLVFMIVLNIAWPMMIGKEKFWQLTGLRIISALSVAGVLFVCQKFFIHNLAVRFHETAFHDRLVKTKAASDVIDRLNRIAKKILRKHAALVASAAQTAKQKSVTVGKPRRKFEFRDQHLFHDDTAIGMSLSVPEAPSGHQRAISVDRIVQSRSPDIISNSGPLSDIEGSSPSIYEGNKSQFSWFQRNNKGLEKAMSSHDSETVDSDTIEMKRPERIFLTFAKQIASGVTINTSAEAKRIARRIFLALSPETAGLLIAEKCMPVKNPKIYSGLSPSELGEPRVPGSLILTDFLPHYHDVRSAKRAMQIFDMDDNGSITNREMKDTVVNLYRERKNLASSLTDVGSAVGKLDNLLSVITLIITLFCSLLIFEISLSSFVLTGISLVLPATFMFGNIAAAMFDGFIFLFVTHPFDVGDRLLLDGEFYTVKELGVLSTILMRWDGQVTYSPNVMLSNREITNLRRSPNMTDIFEIQIAFNTPKEKLNLLRSRIIEFVQSESKDFAATPRTEFLMKTVQQLNKLIFQVWIEHRSNWQDHWKRHYRKNKFYFFIIQTMIDIEISYEPVKQLIQFTTGLPITLRAHSMNPFAAQ